VITVVDYGMGNLRNVRRALESLGLEVLVTPHADDIRRANTLILPGVGAFGEAVRHMDRLQLRSPLLDHVHAGKFLLGICLGMQLLYERSEESPGASGLGVFSGGIERFEGGVKTPHVGWNDVVARTADFFGDAAGSRACMYFVHSYYAPVSAESVATTTYGTTFASAVRRGNVVGVQFHPEKSQDAGLVLLRRLLTTH
jgi:imidazole glycerol phosphate synthase glutamine amidotransferase subunit